jgi:tRNA(fMet)-specific endonuclease VapC
MGLILDSSLLIAHEKGKFDLAGFLATRDESSVALASITASELLHGCHRAGNEWKETRTRYVEGILSKFECIPFTVEEARHHALIWADLARRGQMIGSHDLLIAATAISLGFPLATLNLDEFSQVTGLVVVERSVLSPFDRSG